MRVLYISTAASSTGPGRAIPRRFDWLISVSRPPATTVLHLSVETGPSIRLQRLRFVSSAFYINCSLINQTGRQHGRHVLLGEIAFHFEAAWAIAITKSKKLHASAIKVLSA